MTTVVPHGPALGPFDPTYMSQISHFSQYSAVLIDDNLFKVGNFVLIKKEHRPLSQTSKTRVKIAQIIRIFQTESEVRGLVLWFLQAFRLPAHLTQLPDGAPPLSRNSDLIWDRTVEETTINLAHISGLTTVYIADFDKSADEVKKEKDVVYVLRFGLKESRGKLRLLPFPREKIRAVGFPEGKVTFPEPDGQRDRLETIDEDEEPEERPKRKVLAESGQTRSSGKKVKVTEESWTSRREVTEEMEEEEQPVTRQTRKRKLFNSASQDVTTEVSQPYQSRVVTRVSKPQGQPSCSKEEPANSRMTRSSPNEPGPSRSNNIWDEPGPSEAVKTSPRRGSKSNWCSQDLTKSPDKSPIRMLFLKKKGAKQNILEDTPHTSDTLIEDVFPKRTPRVSLMSKAVPVESDEEDVDLFTEAQKMQKRMVQKKLTDFGKQKVRKVVESDSENEIEDVQTVKNKPSSEDEEEVPPKPVLKLAKGLSNVSLEKENVRKTRSSGFSETLKEEVPQTRANSSKSGKTRPGLANVNKGGKWKPGSFASQFKKPDLTPQISSDDSSSEASPSIPAQVVTRAKQSLTQPAAPSRSQRLALPRQAVSQPVIANPQDEASSDSEPDDGFDNTLSLVNDIPFLDEIQKTNSQKISVPGYVEVKGKIKKPAVQKNKVNFIESSDEETEKKQPSPRPSGIYMQPYVLLTRIKTSSKVEDWLASSEQNKLPTKHDSPSKPATTICTSPKKSISQNSNSPGKSTQANSPNEANTSKSSQESSPETVQIPEMSKTDNLNPQSSISQSPSPVKSVPKTTLRPLNNVPKPPQGIAGGDQLSTINLVSSDDEESIILDTPLLFQTAKLTIPDSSDSESDGENPLPKEFRNEMRSDEKAKTAAVNSGLRCFSLPEKNRTPSKQSSPTRPNIESARRVLSMLDTPEKKQENLHPVQKLIKKNLFLRELSPKINQTKSPTTRKQVAKKFCSSSSSSSYYQTPELQPVDPLPVSQKGKSGPSSSSSKYQSPELQPVDPLPVSQKSKSGPSSSTSTYQTPELQPVDPLPVFQKGKSGPSSSPSTYQTPELQPVNPFPVSQKGKSGPSSSSSTDQTPELQPVNPFPVSQKGKSGPSSSSSTDQTPELQPVDPLPVSQKGKSGPSSSSSKHQTPELQPVDPLPVSQKGKSVPSSSSSTYQTPELQPVDPLPVSQKGKSGPSSSSSTYQTPELQSFNPLPSSQSDKNGSSSNYQSPESVSYSIPSLGSQNNKVLISPASLRRSPRKEIPSTSYSSIGGTPNSEVSVISGTPESVVKGVQLTSREKLAMNTPVEQIKDVLQSGEKTPSKDERVTQLDDFEYAEFVFSSPDPHCVRKTPVKKKSDTDPVLDYSDQLRRSPRKTEVVPNFVSKNQSRGSPEKLANLSPVMLNIGETSTESEASKPKEASKGGFPKQSNVRHSPRKLFVEGLEGQTEKLEASSSTMNQEESVRKTPERHSEVSPKSPRRNCGWVNQLLLTPEKAKIKNAAPESPTRHSPRKTQDKSSMDSPGSLSSDSPSSRKRKQVLTLRNMSQDSDLVPEKYHIEKQKQGRSKKVQDETDDLSQSSSGSFDAMIASNSDYLSNSKKRKASGSVPGRNQGEKQKQGRSKKVQDETDDLSSQSSLCSFDAIIASNSDYPANSKKIKASGSVPGKSQGEKQKRGRSKKVTDEEEEDLADQLFDQLDKTSSQKEHPPHQDCVTVTEKPPVIIALNVAIPKLLAQKKGATTKWLVGKNQEPLESEGTSGSLSQNSDFTSDTVTGETLSLKKGKEKSKKYVIPPALKRKTNLAINARLAIEKKMAACKESRKATAEFLAQHPDAPWSSGELHRNGSSDDFTPVSKTKLRAFASSESRSQPLETIPCPEEEAATSSSHVGRVKVTEKEEEPPSDAESDVSIHLPPDTERKRKRKSKRLANSSVASPSLSRMACLGESSSQQYYKSSDESSTEKSKSKKKKLKKKQRLTSKAEINKNLENLSDECYSSSDSEESEVDEKQKKYSIKTSLGSPHMSTRSQSRQGTPINSPLVSTRSQSQQGTPLKTPLKSPRASVKTPQKSKEKTPQKIKNRTPKTGKTETPQSKKKTLQRNQTPQKKQNRTPEKCETPRHSGRNLTSKKFSTPAKTVSTPSKKASKGSATKGKSMRVKSTPQKGGEVELQEMPGREREMADILAFVRCRIAEGTSGCMYISGVPGTGKTASVTQVVHSLQQQKTLPPFKLVQVSGMELTQPQHVFCRVAESLLGLRASASVAQERLQTFFLSEDPRKQPTLLVVDELDMLCTRRQDVVYSLFEWPTKPQARLVVLAIANTLDLPERALKGRVASRLGLSRQPFHPYTFSQLEKIVEVKLTHTHQFDPDARQLVARKVASVSGDARRALDICRRAQELAGPNKKVGMQHVTTALDEMVNSKVTEAIRNCSALGRLLLRCLMLEMRRTGLEESTFQQVYDAMTGRALLDGVQTCSITLASDALAQLSSLRLVLAQEGDDKLQQRLALNVGADDLHYALLEASGGDRDN